MSLLLSWGADPTVLLEDGRTLLMSYAKAGRVGCIKRLLQDRRVVSTINRTVQTQYGRLTALHYVCMTENLDPGSRFQAVQVLFQAGANSTYGYPAPQDLLLYGVQSGERTDDDWRRSLVNSIKQNGQQLAKYYYHENMRKDEIKESHLYDPDRLYKRDVTGNTLLHAIIANNNAKLVAWLIRDKAMGIHSHVKAPQNLLHLVGNGRVTGALLDLGVDPTVKIEDGKPHVACSGVARGCS